MFIDALAYRPPRTGPCADRFAAAAAENALFRRQNMSRSASTRLVADMRNREIVDGAKQMERHRGDLLGVIRFVAIVGNAAHHHVRVACKRAPVDSNRQPTHSTTADFRARYKPIVSTLNTS